MLLLLLPLPIMKIGRTLERQARELFLSPATHACMPDMSRI
jgi:hypothetical protein